MTKVSEMVSRHAKISIFLLFAVLSVAAVGVYMVKGQILSINSNDLTFHLNRIETFRQAIVDGNGFAFRNFETFNKIGNAINFFYPYAYMYLWAVIYVLVPGPVTAFYLGELLLVFATLYVAYYSARTIKISRTFAVVFAILWGFGTYRTHLALNIYVLGEALAYAFIPLALAGAYKLYFDNQRRWVLLGLGMALVTYAHLLSTLLVGGVIFVMAVFSLVIRFDWQKVINTFKAIGLYLALTLYFFVPFVYEMKQTSILATVKMEHVIFLKSLTSVIENSINNGITFDGWMDVSLGLTVMISMVLYFIWFKKMNMKERVTGGFSIALMVFSTSIFPWYDMPKVLANVIQFPYRLYGLTTLFAFVWLVMYLDRTVHVSRVRKLTIGSVFMFVLLISFSGQVISTYDAASENPPVITDEKGKVAYNVVTNDTYYDFLQTKSEFTGRADYAPINAVDHDYRNTQGIIDHQALVRSGAGLQKETLNPVKTTPSMLRYNVKALAGNTVDVPVMIYGNEVVRINGKRVSTTRSERGTLLVKLPENARRLTVAFGTPTWVYPLWILAIVTLVGTLVYLVKSGRKERSEDAR